MKADVVREGQAIGSCSGFAARFLECVQLGVLTSAGRNGEHQNCTAGAAVWRRITDAIERLTDTSGPPN